MTDEIIFAPETETFNPVQSSWKILIVDDEQEVHQVTRIALADVQYQQKNLSFYSAYSASQARAFLQKNPDIAVVLLDVVMEKDDSGLQLVREIREKLKLQALRIVLRTGQPGQAPEKDIIYNYDINDYKTKVELTAERLFSTIIAALRSYHEIVLRYEAEAQLLKKSQQLENERNIFIGGPVVVMQRGLDFQSPLSYISENVEQILGYRAGELLQHQVDFCSLVDASDLEKVSNYTRQAVAAHKNSFVNEYRVRARSGQLLWLEEYNTVLRSSAGEPVALYSYFIDHTYQKEQENLYTEQCIQGIVQLSANGIISRVNHAFARMMELNPADFPGLSFFNFEQNRKKDSLRDLMKKGSMSVRHETVLQTGGKKLLPCLVDLVPVRDLSGEIKEYQIFVVDVSEQKELEKKLKKSLHAEKRFLASMSHEVRTPLTTIMGYLDLLRETTLGSDQKEFVDYISVSSRHLYSLISDILDVSKIDAGELNLRPEEFLLEEKLAECAVLVTPRLQAGVKLQLHIPELGYYVLADASRISQIVLNLLVNAARITREGFLRLAIEEVQEQAQTLQLAIVVQGGMQMSQEQLKNLFQPFGEQQPGESAGSGLGLYLSRSLAGLMGGSLEVKSEENKGSRFVLRLPLAKGASQATRYSFDQIHVLVVINEQYCHDMVVAGLQNTGATVVAPENLEKSIDIINHVSSQKKLDIVIIDIDTFHKHLEAVLQVATELFPGIAIIALKSEANAFHSTAISKAINKPFSRSQLLKHMAEALQRQRQEPADLSQARILVAEDVELNRILLCRLFERMFQIRVDAVSNGAEAVEKAKQKKYQIVFMDIEMPVMNGIEAVQQIRSFAPDLPVVALTANAFAEDITRALQAGMSEYLTKPLEKSDVEAVLRKYLPASFPAEN